MKHAIAVLLLVLAAGGIAVANEEKKRTLSIAVTADTFFPFNSTTRDRFGDVWLGFGAGIFDRRAPLKWQLAFDVDFRRNDDVGKATLIPVTIGAQRALGMPSRGGWQPYVAARVGPYYGKVEGDRLPVEEDTIGLNANASLGVIYKQRYTLSLRYDYFSRFARTNFDGLSLRLALRVLDIKL